MILSRNKFLFFLILALFFSCESIVLGPFSFLPRHDVGDSMFPRHLAISQAFWKEGFSNWFPWQASGVDRLAQDISWIHMEEWFYLILPPWLVFQIFIVLSFFISGYFTYCIAREHLYLSEKAALFAGVLYSLYGNGSLQPADLGYSIFPFMLWALNKIRKEKQGIQLWFYVAGLAFLCSTCCSIALTLVFLLVFLCPWLVWICNWKTKKDVLILFVFYGIILLPQLLPAMALSLNAVFSHRNGWNPYQNLEGWARVTKATLSAVFAYSHPLNHFRNALFLPLILLAVLLTRLKEKYFNILFLFLLTTTVGNIFFNVFKALFYEHFSVIKSFQFNRIGNMTHFFYPLCAVFALEKIPKEKFFRVGKRCVSWSTLLTVFVVTIVSADVLLLKKQNSFLWSLGQNYHQMYQHPVMKKIAEEQRQASFPFRVATVTPAHYWNVLEPTFAHAYGLETVDGYSNIYPKRYHQFWMQVIEPLKEKYPDYFNWFQDWGSRIHLFLSSKIPSNQPVRFEEMYRLNLLSLANVKYIISSGEFPLQHDKLIPIVAPEKPSIPDIKVPIFLRWWKNLWIPKPLYIYRNEGVVSRFFLASRLKTFSNEQELLEAMGRTEANSLMQTVYIKEGEANLDLSDKMMLKESQIKLLHYESDKIELEVTADGASILVVTNSYSPFWEVAVDENKEKIFPAYHAFWGVLMKKGKHHVVFRYHPPYKFRWAVSSLSPQK